MTGYFCTMLSGAVYRFTLIGSPNRHAGTKMSCYVEYYEYIKVHGGKAQEFLIHLNILNYMNVIQEHVDISHGFD